MQIPGAQSVVKCQALCQFPVVAQLPYQEAGVYGSAARGRLQHPQAPNGLRYPHGSHSAKPRSVNTVALNPHETDIVTLQLVSACVRGQRFAQCNPGLDPMQEISRQYQWRT